MGLCRGAGRFEPLPTGSAARAVLGGLPFSLWWSVGLVSFSELGHSCHALVLVSSLVCQNAHGVQRGAGYNGRGRGQLADLQSSVAVQTWIDADRRYDLAGHAKLANTIRPTIDYIGSPSPGGPERWFVRPDRLGGSGATTT